MSQEAREKALAKQRPKQIRQVNNFISRQRGVPVKLEKIVGKFFFDGMQGGIEDVEKVSDLSYLGWLDEYDRLVEANLASMRERDAKKVKLISADCKDIDGLVDAMQEALADLGISMRPHPDFEGSDTYGFLLSNQTITDDDIKEYSIRPEAEDEEVEE